VHLRVRAVDGVRRCGGREGSEGQEGGSDGDDEGAVGARHGVIFDVPAVVPVAVQISVRAPVPSWGRMGE
jgi:hypothetical protein